MATYRRYRAALRLALALAQCLNGSELVRASLDAVRAAGEPLLLVEGAPAHYGRFGFVRADELGLLPPPEALYDWAFQVAVLDTEALLPQGRVVYSEPFRH